MITLEPITRGNAMIFKEVRLRALRDSPSAFGSTYAKESALDDAQWLERAAKWSDGRSMGYLAMDEGTACGIAAGFVDSKDAAKAHLVSMWVAPAHRRAGAGRMLVEAIADWARNGGAGTLLLMVTSSNDGAMRFYERLGFRLTGRTEPYPNDAALIEHEMSRAIAE